PPRSRQGGRCCCARRIGAACRPRRGRQEDVALHRAIRPARARPGVDHRLHHPQPRLLRVRHLVRDRCRIRPASANGRRLQRLANTDPFTQVTEMVGSGPFKFVKEEFEPGHRVVYVKNKDYVPRKEPPSWASGSKVVKVDRVEWLYIPDAMTKVAALNNGEADWWENPPADVWPVLAANPDVTVARVDPLSSPIMVRFNHTQPPFD